MPRKTEQRVIIDTNCWISFLIGRRMSRLVDLLSSESVKLVVCQELLDELQDVTSRPKLAKFFPQKEVDSLIEFMELIGERFEPRQKVQICRDSADDYLLALAIESHAHYLVTGDQDLLVIKKIKNCRIVDVITIEKEI